MRPKLAFRKAFRRARRAFLKAIEAGEIGRWYAIEGSPLESYLSISELFRMDMDTISFARVEAHPPTNLHEWLVEVQIAPSPVVEQAGWGVRHSVRLDHFPRLDEVEDVLRVFGLGAASAEAALLSTLGIVIEHGVDRDFLVDLMNETIVRHVLTS